MGFISLNEVCLAMDEIFSAMLLWLDVLHLEEF
jgi:hypothetical protein